MASMLDQSVAEPQPSIQVVELPVKPSPTRNAIPSSHSGSDSAPVYRSVPGERSQLFWMRPSQTTAPPATSHNESTVAANPYAGREVPSRSDPTVRVTAATDLQLFGCSLEGKVGRDVPQARRERKLQTHSADVGANGQSSLSTVKGQAQNQNLFFNNLLVRVCLARIYILISGRGGGGGGLATDC